MSSTEKPGFFSKLFGLSVSRSTSCSDGGSSSNSNGGSPVHEDSSDTNGSPPVTSKPLRYLSPTAIESSFSLTSSRNIDSNADIARKRPLENPQITSSFKNGSFYLSDTAKRFRGNAANTSLTSEPVSRLELPRLDTTWSAGMGVFSPSNLSVSPCSSVRSLRSRITRPSSRTSVLSSKTAALLGHIEKVNTPAQDARRMPMLRVGLNKERWNSLGPSTISNPPLNRISTVPSRYQVMSSFLTPMQKKPYWRDAAREKPEVVSEHSGSREPALSVPSTSSHLNGEKNGFKEQHIKAPTHLPPLKGFDGSNVNRDRSVFSANDIYLDDSADMDALKNVKVPATIQFSFPTSGFLSKEVKPSFSFKKPVKVTEESSEESDSEEDSSEGSGSGSGSCRGDSDREDGDNTKAKSAEKTSDTSSSAENTSKETSNEDAIKPSPSRTTPNVPAATFVAQASPVKEAQSLVTISEPSSSSSTASVSWDCPTCCVSNKAANSKCACCGESKPGSSSPSSSNVLANNAVKSSSSSVPSSANWDCPTCCVNNKAADTKCACCGENKPGETPVSVSSNVFGEKAFKPAAFSSSTVSFGFGNASSPLPSFGIKPASENAPSNQTTTEFKFGIKPSTESPTSSSTSIPTILVTQPVPKKNPASTLEVAPKPFFGTMESTAGATRGSSTFSFGLKSGNGDNVSNGGSIGALPIPLFGSAPSTVSTTTAAPLFNIVPQSLGISSTSSSVSTSSPTVSTSSLFNSSTPFTPSSTLFGAPTSSSILQSFGSSTASSTITTTSVPLFVSSTQSIDTRPVPLFGNTSTTVAATVPSSGGSGLSSLPFSFGTSSTLSKAPFGVSNESKPLFGAAKSCEDEGPGSKKALFGASSAFSFGGQSNNVGASNIFGSSSSATPNVFGGLTQSASAPSFSVPSAPPSSFNFGSQAAPTVPPPSTFNFSGSEAPSAAPSAIPFVFGMQPVHAAPPSFGSMGGVPPTSSSSVPAPDASNPFAFHSSSSGSRKMIQAKRRLPGKR